MGRMEQVPVDDGWIIFFLWPAHAKRLIFFGANRVRAGAKLAYTDASINSASSESLSAKSGPQRCDGTNAHAVIASNRMRSSQANQSPQRA